MLRVSYLTAIISIFRSSGSIMGTHAISNSATSSTTAASAAFNATNTRRPLGWGAPASSNLTGDQITPPQVTHHGNGGALSPRTSVAGGGAPAYTKQKQLMRTGSSPDINVTAAAGSSASNVSNMSKPTNVNAGRTSQLNRIVTHFPFPILFTQFFCDFFSVFSCICPGNI